MAQFWTRKKEDKTDKDVPAEEFIKKMVDMQRVPEERRKVDNIESVE